MVEQGLNYPIRADASELTAELRKVQDESKEAGKALAENFQKASTDAGRSIDKFVTDLMAKLTPLADAAMGAASKFGEAWAGGAEGAENVVNQAFGSINGMVDGFVTKIAARAGPAGALFALAWSAGLKDVVSGQLDNLKPVVADKLDQALGSDFAQNLGGNVAGVFAKSVNAGLDAVLPAVAHAADGIELPLGSMRATINEWADAIKSKIDDMVEGIRTALQKLAGTFTGIGAAVQSALDEINKRIDTRERDNELIGKSAGEQAALKVKFELLQKVGKAWEELNDAEREAAVLAATRAANVAAEGEELRKAEQDAKQYEATVRQLTSSLERQASMAERNAGLGGKTAYERALEQFQAQAQGTGRKADAAQDDGVLAKMEEAAQRMQAAAGDKFNFDMAEQLKRQTDAFDLQTRSIGQNAGEVARLRFVQMELQAAQKAGVPVTDELRASIDASAEAVARAAQQAQLAKDAFSSFQQVGQTVASSLERAFGDWIKGTEVTWKSFIKGLEADLARLAFKKGIEAIITGGGTAGGAGLVGGLTSLFLPGRAQGGPVDGGSPYIVGEKGPELFVPRSAGTVMANGAVGGGAQDITMTINLAGANGDDTIRQISAQAARQAALAAIQQANDSLAGRQRRLHLLGA